MLEPERDPLGRELQGAQGAAAGELLAGKVLRPEHPAQRALAEHDEGAGLGA